MLDQVDSAGDAERTGQGGTWTARLMNGFRSRELIVRDGDRLRYLQISRGRQIAALSVALVLGAWVLAATAGSLWWVFDLGGERADLRHQRLANLDLLTEVSDYHEDFARIIGTLEGNQNLLLTQLAERGGGRAADNGIRAQLKDTQDDEARMLIAGQALRSRLERFRGELVGLAARDAGMKARLEATQRSLLETRADGAQVAAASERLGRVLRQTETALARQTAERSKLESELASAQQSVKRTSRESASAERRLRDALDQAESDVARLSAEKSTLSTKLADSRRALKESKDENAELVAARDHAEEALQQADGDLARLQDERRAVDDQLAQANQNLTQTKKLNESLNVEKTALRAEIQSLYREVAIAPDSNSQLKAQVSALGVKLDAADRQIASLQSERDSLQARAEDLKTRLAQVSEDQTAVVQRLTDRTLNGMDMLERVVAMTGLDVNDLIGGTNVASLGLSQGGPYIGEDLASGGDPQLELKSSVAVLDQQMDRWEALQDVVRSIPLSSPLDQYVVTSGFGERKDPINGRKAVHYGVDLKAALRTPVMATAPGTVVFAGWRGTYGRMVEIDHGNGIHTRYGHLAKILVKKGQVVTHRQQIGLLGNSGRSTGPHVHYEIVVNGQPYDPARFMMAGRNAFKE